MDDTTAVLRRVKAQLRGWHVWITSAGGLSWAAVPAPRGVSLADAVRMPGRVEAPDAGALIAACQARYGWHDTCATCDMPARDCGHVGAEREV